MTGAMGLTDAAYPILRAVHVGAVTLSGMLFAARALAQNVLAARWPMTAPVRRLSYVIDTVLLAAALLLAATIGQYPFVQAWLTAKVALLAVYIVLGSFALRRARARSVRLACSVGAFAVFLFIVSIARAHDPLGILAGVAQHGG